MLMSKLVFLLKHSRKINFFCLLVKGIIKPRPSGEVAAIADGEGNCQKFGGRTQFAHTTQPVASYQPAGEPCGLPPSFNREKRTTKFIAALFFNTYLCVFLFNIISLCVYQRRVTNTNLYFIPLLFRTFIINFFKTTAVRERTFV